jgi:hypothetical protein
MLEVLRSAIGALLLVVTTLTPGLAEARQPQAGPVQTQDRSIAARQGGEGTRARSLPFVRTELYFGTAMPEGVVTEEMFRGFIDEHVTPRFPDGLTIVKADGQFRNGEGDIIKEQSFVLILLYPYQDFAEGSRRIESIRRRYKQDFVQESVLRVDDPFIVWVSF